MLRHRTLTIRHLPGSHSNKTIATCLIEVLEEFEIYSKIRAMTLDNARNVLHVSEIVNKKLNITTIQFGCGCHIINLIVKKVLKLTAVDVDEILNEVGDNDTWALNVENSATLINSFENLIKKCRKIASTFHMSTQLNESLIKVQKEMTHLSNKKNSRDRT